MRKRMTDVILLVMLIVVGGTCARHGSAAELAAPPEKDCSPVGDLNFVCGVSNVEDFLPIEGGRWLVGGSLRGLDPRPSTVDSAGLYLIDTAQKSVRAVFLKVAARGDSRYAGCAPPDLKHLATHGLDVTVVHGATTVYAVNHDARQSVEVFRLHPADAAAEWMGCVILPPAAVGNAIAVFANGDFVVSKFTDADDKDSMQKALSGKITGTVYRWSQLTGFSEVPGTRLSGANGVLVSPDEKWLYVNAWGSHEILRVPLKGTGNTTVVKVDFSPDNLRWTPDGKIFVTGQYLNPIRGGLDGWTTARLDPKAMTIATVVREPGYAQSDDGTSTVQVGHTLWIGTFRGDRVAYRSAP